MMRAWRWLAVCVLAGSQAMAAPPPKPAVPMPPPLPPAARAGPHPARLAQDAPRPGPARAHAQARRRDVARGLPRVQRGPGVLLAGRAVRDGRAPAHHPGLPRPRGAGVERLALGGGGSAGLYQVYRDPEVEGRELWGQGQWALLRKLVDERKPRNIAVNVSHTHAFSDGLSLGEWEQLAGALGPWTSRVVRAEGLAHDYISRARAGHAAHLPPDDGDRRTR